MSDIKLFKLSSERATEIPGASMKLEKPLQKLFEKNLDSLLGVRFLASEYTITDGRIDTLGLDENNSPVIIEYKRESNENVINQGLFYLDLLMDHRDIFKLLVMEKYDKKVAGSVDWSAPRLLCIAANFNKYDEHAVRQMNRNIELIRYRRFGDELLMLDLLTATTSKSKKGVGGTPDNGGGKRRTVLDDIKRAGSEQKRRYEALEEYIFSLGDDVWGCYLKGYVAFRRIRNFVRVQLRNRLNVLLLSVNLNPDEEEMVDGFIRDMRGTGHFGTGDVEIRIGSDEDLERAKPFIKKAYDET